MYINYDAGDVVLRLTKDEAKALVVLFDNSVLKLPVVSGLQEQTYYGLTAFRDQLVWDIGDVVRIDTNDVQQMGTVYHQVDAMFKPNKTGVNV